MQNLLVIAPPSPLVNTDGSSSSGGYGPTGPLMSALAAAGHTVRRVTPGRAQETTEALCRAFAGKPPHLLLADLSDAADLLPLQHVRRFMRQVWGDDLPLPPCLALLAPAHLGRPEWLAHVDDFLLPPYTTVEVRARIEMLLFRRRQLDNAQNSLSFAEIRLDLATGRAHTEDGTCLPLTPREFDLLRFLVTHRGKLFTRERLLDFVWGVDFSGGERTVDIHVRRLRAKLPPDTARLLETRRGIGYGFSPGA